MLVDAEFYADSRVLYEKFRFWAKFDTRRVWKGQFLQKIHFLGIFHEKNSFMYADNNIEVLLKEALGITYKVM